MAANSDEKSANMASTQASQGKLPQWLRWAALLWLLVWVPAYWRTWGPENFLRLCDLAVILACIGLWSGSALLISSQAVASFAVGIVWAAAAAGESILGRPLIAGTEYLFDPRFPLWVRLLSLFHIVLPLVLLWALGRTGYDRRGWRLQSAIAFFAFVASRFTPPAENINYAFTDPFIHRAWGPPAVHVVTSALFMILVAYLPAHLVLRRFFPPPQRNT
jgi:hypothetical protein